MKWIYFFLSKVVGKLRKCIQEDLDTWLWYYFIFYLRSQFLILYRSTIKCVRYKCKDLKTFMSRLRPVFRTCIAIVFEIYLHEAVVEVKSKKRSCYSDILSNGLLQDWHDNVISLRAWKLIELRRKSKRHSSSGSTMMTTPAEVEIMDRMSMGECNWEKSCYKKNDFGERHCDKWLQRGLSDDY